MIKLTILLSLCYLACGIALILIGGIRFTLLWIAETSIIDKILMVLLWPILLIRMIVK